MSQQEIIGKVQARDRSHVTWCWTWKKEKFKRSVGDNWPDNRVGTGSLLIIAHKQRYLRDIVGSVSDLYNKANIAIRQVTQMFWFPSTYKSFVYTILCNRIMSKEINVHILIKNYFVAKKCQPSSEPLSQSFC